MARADAQASEAAIREALDGVLARREFAPPGEDPMLRLFEWLGDLLPAIDLPRSVGWPLLSLLAIVFAVFLGWLLVQLGLQLPRRRGFAGVESAEAARALASRVGSLRAEAEQARRGGDLRLALRLSLFALFVGLGRRGDLDYRDAWTGRELLERGKPDPEVFSLLAPLVTELDAKLFGRQPATPEDVERMERLCDQWLGGTA